MEEENISPEQIEELTKQAKVQNKKISEVIDKLIFWRLRKIYIGV